MEHQPESHTSDEEDIKLTWLQRFAIKRIIKKAIKQDFINWGEE